MKPNSPWACLVLVTLAAGCASGPAGQALPEPAAVQHESLEWGANSSDRAAWWIEPGRLGQEFVASVRVEVGGRGVGRPCASLVVQEQFYTLLYGDGAARVAAANLPGHSVKLVENPGSIVHSMPFQAKGGFVFVGNVLLEGEPRADVRAEFELDSEAPFRATRLEVPPAMCFRDVRDLGGGDRAVVGPLTAAHVSRSPLSGGPALAVVYVETDAGHSIALETGGDRWSDSGTGPTRTEAFLSTKSPRLDVMLERFAGVANADLMIHFIPLPEAALPALALSGVSPIERDRMWSTVAPAGPSPRD